MSAVTLLRAGLNGLHNSSNHKLMINSLEIARYLGAEVPHLPQDLSKRIRNAGNYINIHIKTWGVMRLTPSSGVFGLRLGEVAYWLTSKQNKAAGL